MKKTNTDLSFTEKSQQIQRDYRLKAGKNITLISDIWKKLIHYAWNDDAFHSFYSMVHTMAGSAATFGFLELGDAAKKLNDYLVPLSNHQHRPSESERLQISALLKTLNDTRKTLEEGEQQTVVTKIDVMPKVKKGMVVYIVDDDRHFVLYLATLFSDLGYETRTFSEPPLALQYLERCPPDIVIMDVMFPNHTGFDSVADFRDVIGKDIPFIFISSRSDLDARVTAVRSGGNAYFTKPFEFNQLVEQIDSLVTMSEKPKYKVLIVDDDIELSDFYANCLRDAEYEVTVINKPINLLMELEKFDPDLVIMDYQMPDFNGIELVHVIRQSQQYIALPVLLLTANRDQKIRDEAIGLGVNEFLNKPINKDDLTNVARKLIRSSISLYQIIQKVSQRDPVTNLCNRQYFLEQLEFSIASSGNDKSMEHVSALFYVAIDNYQVIREKTGLANQDLYAQQACALFSSILEDGDCATEFSENVFLILSRHRSVEQLTISGKMLNKTMKERPIRLSSNSLSITCSISVIEINEHVPSARQLIHYAEENCNSLQKDGGNQYIVTEYIPPTAEVQCSIEESISIALEQGLFKLVYQPIVNIENRNYEQYEVLVRMLTPENKTLLPQYFFETASKTGQMSRIDRWVIEHAITSMSDDSHIRSNTDLFIKIAGKTLSEPMLIPWISNSINQSHISGERRIIFTLSEKDALFYQKHAEKFARNIDALGCGLAIDHFGSTDNTMQLVRSLQPSYVVFRYHVLKDIMTNLEKQGQVKSLLKYAEGKNIKVVASAIENPTVLSFLWALGVRYFQGYFIQEPNSALTFNFNEFNTDELS